MRRTLQSFCVAYFNCAEHLARLSCGSPIASVPRPREPHPHASNLRDAGEWGQILLAAMGHVQHQTARAGRYLLACHDGGCLALTTTNQIKRQRKKSRLFSMSWYNNDVPCWTSTKHGWLLSLNGRGIGKAVGCRIGGGGNDIMICVAESRASSRPLLGK